MKPLTILSLSGAALLCCTVTSNAQVTMAADPGYAGATFLTLDPDLYAPAQRNVAADRELRQTFQLGSTIEVSQLVTGLDTQAGSTLDGGLVISFYEVADVNAGSWSPGTLMKTFTIPTSTPLLSTEFTMGFTFSGSDIFTLPQRDTGTEGYGMTISNADGLSNVGAWHHSNDGTDNYTAGIYYSEGGSPPNAARDMGIALFAVPEPTTLALVGFGSLALLTARRRT